jgi:hypothetical protein
MSFAGRIRSGNKSFLAARHGGAHVTLPRNQQTAWKTSLEESQRQIHIDKDLSTNVKHLSEGSIPRHRILDTYPEKVKTLVFLLLAPFNEKSTPEANVF